MRGKVVLFAFILLEYSLSHSQEILNIGKFSWKFFGDFFYNISRDTGIVNVKNAALCDKKNLNGFIARRINFGYD